MSATAGLRRCAAVFYTHDGRVSREKRDFRLGLTLSIPIGLGLGFGVVEGKVEGLWRHWSRGRTNDMVGRLTPDLDLSKALTLGLDLRLTHATVFLLRFPFGGASGVITGRVRVVGLGLELSGLRWCAALPLQRVQEWVGASQSKQRLGLELSLVALRLDAACVMDMIRVTVTVTVSTQ